MQKTPYISKISEYEYFFSLYTTQPYRIQSIFVITICIQSK